MRFESNDLSEGVIEVVAFGTAVSDGSRLPAEASSDNEPQGSPLDLACLSTTNEIIGQDFQQSLGMVKGISCRSKHFFATFGAAFKSGTIGGEIETWNSLCEQARVQATERVVQEAVSLGAKGIVGMRYETNEVMPGLSETIAFGTAVA